MAQKCMLLASNMDSYGTDWGGPVPVCDDMNSDTVLVDDLPPLLSATQLTDQLPSRESLTEDWMSIQ